MCALLVATKNICPTRACKDYQNQVSFVLFSVLSSSNAWAWRRFLQNKKILVCQGLDMSSLGRRPKRHQWCHCPNVNRCGQ